MVDYYNKMSGSDEEFESQTQSGMSKAELRRSNKPIMEKRRRARINQCLDELKSLILDAMKKDPSRHSKLEKADILEMTVKHLQTVQRQQLSTAVATNPTVLTKFRTGFSECATEVSRYVSHLENVDPAVKQRLVSHLNNCVSNLQQMTPFYSHYVPYMPERLYPEVKVGFQSDFQNGDENNNGSARIQIPSGVQLIPSRLPTGELALLVPQSAGISANFPFFPPAPSESSSRVGPSSAFTAVHRSNSPLLSPSTSTSSFGEESHHSEQYPQSYSPNHQQQNQRRFKIPEPSPSSSKSLSSSPETQKSHISSTSDQKSPILKSSEPKNEISKKELMNIAPSIVPSVIEGFSLRQPLSVITDKNYNRSITPSNKRENLKRSHSGGLLVISEKKAKLDEPTSSCSGLEIFPSVIQNNIKVYSSPIAEDLSGRPSTSNGRTSNNNSNMMHANRAEHSGINNDMWRPW